MVVGNERRIVMSKKDKFSIYLSDIIRMMRSLICIIFIPILLIVVLCFILYLPFDYIKYKRSYFYKEFKEKYTFFSGISPYFKMYNDIKKSRLPIEYIRNNSVDNIYGYFVYNKELIIVDCCVYYDEYNKAWAIVESHEDDRERFYSVEEMVEVMLDEVNKFAGNIICDRAIVLVDLSEVNEEYVDNLSECKLLLPFEKGKMIDCIKAYIK